MLLVINRNQIHVSFIREQSTLLLLGLYKLSHDPGYFDALADMLVASLSA